LKTLVLNDVHVPFHSAKWQRKVEEYITKDQPDKIVLAGDIADYHALSQHRRNPKWEDNLEAEVAAHGNWLDALRVLAKKAEIVYIEGNHEARWNSYIQNRAPVIRNLGVDWPEYVGIADFDIRMVRSGHKVGCGQGQKVAIYHGHEGRLGSSKFGGGLALRFALNHGCNAHIGHTHKQGTLFGQCGKKLVYGHEGGFGGDLRKPAFDFVRGRNIDWVLGFMVYDSEQTHSPLPKFIKV